MDISDFLAKIIGFYLVVTATAALRHPKSFVTMIKHIASNDFGRHFAGMLALIMGILLVSSHNVWIADWRLVITLISWFVLFKGCLLMIFPEVVKKYTTRIMKKLKFNYVAIFYLILGLFLFIQGFQG